MVLIFSLILVANTQAQQSKPQLKVVKHTVYTDKLFQHGDIYIGPQPAYIDFETIKAAGFTQVINMRTPDEMKELGFYEDYLLKKASIDYYSIPIGDNEFEYSPAKLKEFAQALESSEGKVLMHCGSGYRASQLWAAYLVQYKGKSIDEALAMVKEMGWWPMPMEALLGQKLHVSAGLSKHPLTLVNKY